MNEVTRLMRAVCLAGVLAVPLATHAGGYSGEAELGFVSTGGNTETSTLNLKAKLAREMGGWKHAAKAEVLSAKNDGVTSAERYAAALQTRRELGDRAYVYGLVDGVRDRFSGIPYLLSESVGLGYALLRGGKLTMDGEAGLGARQSKPRGEDVGTDMVLRLNLAAGYALSDTAQLTEDLSVEAGESNTITKSITALSAQVMGNLSMKVSFTVQNISEVPPGSKNTDYETAVTLVYRF